MVVLGHATTLGEAFAFASRAEVNSGLTGVFVEQTGPAAFDILIGPFPGFAAADAIRASVQVKFRHATVKAEAKTADALRLTDLPAIYKSAGAGLTPVEAL